MLAGGAERTACKALPTSRRCNSNPRSRRLFAAKAAAAGNEESGLRQHRSEEQLSQTQKKLERAKAKLVAATSGVGGGHGGSSNLVEQRADNMEKALRCPVNQTMWKDCMIMRCRHMFSRSKSLAHRRCLPSPGHCSSRRPPRADTSRRVCPSRRSA